MGTQTTEESARLQSTGGMIVLLWEEGGEKKRFATNCAKTADDTARAAIDDRRVAFVTVWKKGKLAARWSQNSMSHVQHEGTREPRICDKGVVSS